MSNKDKLLEIQKLVKRAEQLGNRICDTCGTDFYDCEGCPSHDPEDLCVTVKLQELKKSVDGCVKRMKKGDQG